MKEFDEQINNLLHTIMRVIDNIDRDRREFNSRSTKEITQLLLARQEILRLVELKEQENGNGKRK